MIISILQYNENHEAPTMYFTSYWWENVTTECLKLHLPAMCYKILSKSIFISDNIDVQFDSRIVLHEWWKKNQENSNIDIIYIYTHEFDRSMTLIIQ